MEALTKEPALRTQLQAIKFVFNLALNKFVALGIPEEGLIPEGPAAPVEDIEAIVQSLSSGTYDVALEYIDKIQATAKYIGLITNSDCFANQLTPELEEISASCLSASQTLNKIQQMFEGMREMAKPL